MSAGKVDTYNASMCAKQQHFLYLDVISTQASSQQVTLQRTKRQLPLPGGPWFHSTHNAQY